MREKGFGRRGVGLVVVAAVGVLLLGGCEALLPLQAVIGLRSGTTGEAPLTVQFTSSGSTGPIVRREWNFGDPASGAANTSTLESLTHTYADDGVYTVSLTVVGDDGATSRVTTAIVVLNPAPRPQIKVTPQSGPAPLSVTFDLSSSIDPAGIVPAPGGTIVSFSLDFGDGTAPVAGSDLSVPIQHTYSTPEYRTATLTAVDDDGAVGMTTHPITVLGAIATVRAPSSSPSGLAYGDGALWVGDASTKRIYKVRPEDGSVVFSFDAPGTSTASTEEKGRTLGIVPAPTDSGIPGGLAWGDGALWVACLSDGKIYKLNPNVSPTEPGHLLAELENAAFTPVSLAYGGGALWVGNLTDRRIYEVNPATGEVLRWLTGPGTASYGVATQGIVVGSTTGMSWADGALWTISGTTLYKLDPQTGLVITYVAAPATSPRGLAYDGRYLWDVDENGASLGRLYQLVVP
jgi:outer membrane protein assembly factor BamB